MRYICCLSFVIGWHAALPTEGCGQTAAQDPRVAVGLDLGVSILRTSEWAIDRNDIPVASGLSLEMAYGVTPWLAPYVAYDVSVFGQEFSGFNTGRLGILIRLPLSPSPLVPSLRLELGRLTESGRRSFSFGSIGGGIGVYLGRRWELEVAATTSMPFGTGRTERSTVALDLDRANFTRVFVGLRWHFGGAQSTPGSG